ncbi:MAG: sugar ABC transporter substrate-binding protein [Firmicutes bacterium]|nr:sugar ABC transporter substrate-binding protein [Bacillota bacterium]MDD4337682.1 sugar ABC transporter substrate-binding protein [Bacillota bacterium]MDD4792985.1 sugar ABC transporter substrate-binding protein [Bacillota bacterium]
MRRTIRTVAVAALLAALMLMGTVPATAKQFTIGATIWNMSVPFYANFIKGLNDGAAKYGFKLLLRDGQGDPNTQVAVVRQFIVEKVDMIVIVPGDAQAVVPVIRQANAAGIPVIAANNKVGEGAKVVTFVGADDYYFGKQQGKLLVEAIGDSGKVALIMGQLGTSAQILRKKGLDDYLKDYPNIKIVTSVSDDWDSAKALANTQDILSRYPKGQLDAIVCQGPEAVPGAKYSKQAGRTEIRWVLGDYPKDVRDAVKDGTVYGTVNQDPYPQAVEALHMASLYLKGEKSKIPAPNYFLELPLITIKNVDDYPPAW